MDVVVPPVVREVGADEDDITGLKPFDMIAYELRTAALMEKDQLQFGVVVPAIIDERVPVFPYAEGLRRSFGDF